MEISGAESTSMMQLVSSVRGSRRHRLRSLDRTNYVDLQRYSGNSKEEAKNSREPYTFGFSRRTVGILKDRAFTRSWVCCTLQLPVSPLRVRVSECN